MKVLPLKVKLLSPFFNYCEVTTGGAITSRFIGDIALTYAVNRMLRDTIPGIHQEFRRKPNYIEINQLPYYCTVAKPIRVEMTGLYVRNTLFNVDGYTDVGALEAAGKNLFKNYFKIQGVRPEAEFSTCLIFRDSFIFKLPFVVRLGTGRECLAVLDTDKEFDGTVCLNAFTLKHVFGNLQAAIKEVKTYSFEYKLENYILMKNVPLQHARKIFEEQFK